MGDELRNSADIVAEGRNEMGLIVLALLQTSPLPLPAKPDIPHDFSSVICPDDASAQKMLDQYFTVAQAPKNHTIIIPHFFAGLKVTGCAQDSPLNQSDIVIKQAIARKSIQMANGKETYLLFHGINKSGAKVVGIVNETEAHKHPRTDYERWISAWAPGGSIKVENNNDAGSSYTCPSATSARAAVNSIPVKGNEQALRAAFARGLKAHKCQPAPAGQYAVKSVYEVRDIHCGFECVDSFTALDAEINGRRKGLIFDASHF